MSCHYGDTTVHVAVTASEKPREGVDFFPLSVDYEEKMYAVGKIPGSYLKREGRPSEKAILTSRVIDRPIRPLFDKSMRNDVSIVCTVMSVDPDCQPEIVAMIGASIAISISDVPWNGPISGCSVGMIDGEYIINPTEEQRKVSQMATTVASTSTRIAMIEAGANCVSDDDMYNAIMAGHGLTRRLSALLRKSRLKSASLSLSLQVLNPTMICLRQSRHLHKKMLRLLLIQMIREFVTKDSSLSMRQFTQNLTRFIPKAKLSLTSAFIRHRSSLFAVGYSMSRSVLTAEEWTISVLSHQRLA